MVKDKLIVKGFSHCCKVLTYNGLKYIDELDKYDMLYTYDINGGYSEYISIGDINILHDGFYNLTDLKLGTSNGILLSPTNPLVVSTKGGLLISYSKGVVKDTNLLVCIADDIKELNLNVDMYVEGVVSSALNIKIHSNIMLKCVDIDLLSSSLKDKKLKFNITNKGYIRLLEPITEVRRGLVDDIWSKGISTRLSYLLGVLDCLSEVNTVKSDKLRLKHTDSNFILELSYLMLTVGVIPMHISSEGDYYILEYIIPLNLRKLYKSRLYTNLEDTYNIISESRIVKRDGGEGTKGIRLYFRNLENNPLKLSYTYYGSIVEFKLSSTKYCLVSTMGVPIML